MMTRALNFLGYHRLRYAALIFTLATCALLAAWPAAAEPSELWTQWRGPERTGHSAGPAWPGDLSGLEEVWRVELGRGYPGPIVGQDRVFVAETQDDELEVVRALDRATGRELWRAAWPGEGSVPFYARANGDWIRSTPAFDGETLYVGGMEEVLVALDAQTGEIRWRIDFPERFGTGQPDFGFSSSPLIDGEHLYVQAANSIVKLDKTTGETVWRCLDAGAEDADAFTSGAFSSPVLATIAGREQLLVQTRLELVGLDPEDCQVLWRQPVPHFRGMNILTPLAWGDSVLTSSYRNGTYLYSLEKEGNGFQVAESWNYKSPGYMSSPVVVGDHAYLHLQNQRLTCLDLATGESRWTSTPFGKYWSIAVRGDKILALDERGELHLIRANPERFELLDTRKIASAPTWGHVAVTGDEVFVRELEAIAAYRFRR